MSYVKTVWETGDTITAEKLNNLENGVAQAGEFLIVNINVADEALVLDKTYKEIKDSILNGVYVYAISEETDEGYYEVTVRQLAGLEESNGSYSVGFGNIDFTTDNENGYPAVSNKLNKTPVR